MDFGLQGKVALVTGGAKGIGKAIAVALSQEGCFVAITDIDEMHLEETVQELRSMGARCTGKVMNVTHRDEVFSCIAEIRSEFGPVDILVNNAGVVKPGDTASMTDEQWNSVFSVNFTGAFYCCQAVMEEMRERGWGRIVNICSLVIKMIGRPNVASYAASKAALGAITKILAKDLGRSGVTVNAVLPGSIAVTDFNDSIGYPKTVELMPGMDIPVGRRGTPEDVAPAVAFLCSKQAEYITGEFLDVNGGLCMD